MQRSVEELEDRSSNSSNSDEENEGLIKNALSRYSSELGQTGTIDLKVTDNCCLICLSGIRRIQAIWSCKLCYCVFHLVCIQQWAKDGMLLRSSSVLSEHLFPSAASNWSCPACRGDYSKAETPHRYRCFCGKQVDPIPDPWLLAHSCGELCGCELQPQCGHKCLALCHPGACPPCPKTVLVTCYCQRGGTKPRRCGNGDWSCGKICQRTLTCGFHTCEQACHTGSCKACTERVELPCQCGRNVKEVLCSESLWSCGTECREPLSCGHHSCLRVCHSGGCGECPLSGNRSCPCGKQKSDLDCSAQVACCGDTCSKTLSCGLHVCVRLCHEGDCGCCLQSTVKSCRCGLKTKSLLCGQDFLCEGKCASMRQCGRHQCRRKCCVGACPPCEQLCGRQLGCKTHKCVAPCHSGKCYPCVQMVTVSCTCGATSLTVPCGRERLMKRPSCRQPCRHPPTCHHTLSTPHHCHTGNCPPCRQLCGLVHECKHICTSPCHSRPHPIQEKPVVPWKKKEKSLVVDPCPPCSEPVSKACLGEHEVCKLPCSELRDYSCGRACGRLLLCGNHSCARGCHRVIGALDNTHAGEDCLLCEEVCVKPRHTDCRHRCPLLCHTGGCPPCASLLKFQCHCSNTSVYIRCSDWCEANVAERKSLRNCNSLCSKTLSCGHCCTQSCHAGPCIPTSGCTRKVTVRCPCHRIKKVWRCNEQGQLECSQDCLLAIQKSQQRAATAAAEACELKEKGEMAAIAEIERQLRPRKRRRKSTTMNSQQEQVSSTLAYKAKVAVVCVLAVLLLSVTLLILRPVWN